MYRYNTTRASLTLREYGRNIQNLVNYIRTLPDKATRTHHVQALLKVMRQVNPEVKNFPESTQKLWDDVFLIANYDLDVDPIYPIPARPLPREKQLHMPYRMHTVKFRHYGRNIELLLHKAAECTNPEAREQLVIQVLRIMRSFNNTNTLDASTVDTLISEAKMIAGDNLIVDADRVKNQLLHRVNPRSKPKSTRPSSNTKRPYHNNKRNVNNNGAV